MTWKTPPEDSVPNRKNEVSSEKSDSYELSGVEMKVTAKGCQIWDNSQDEAWLSFEGELLENRQ